MQQGYQCPRCGTQVAFGTRFCGNCQIPLNWPTQPQPPPQQQYQQPPPQYQQQYQQQPQQPQQPGYQQQSGPPKKKSKLGIISLAIVLFALVAVGSCVVCVMQPESTDITQPSNTGSKQLTSAEREYLLTISDNGVRMGNALTELGTLLQDTNIGNTQWSTNVAAQIVIIRGLYDEVISISPPSSMNQIHSKYLQAMHHFDSMTDFLVDGIDNMDEDALNQATTEMELGHSLVLEVTDMMNQLK
jgi:hypothetical protein